jgi:hypothetical protein
MIIKEVFHKGIKISVDDDRPYRISFSHQVSSDWLPKDTVRGVYNLVRSGNYKSEDLIEVYLGPNHQQGYGLDVKEYVEAWYQAFPEELI